MEKVFPLFIQKYETFTTDNSASLTNKINSIVQALNQLGKISNDVVHDWNKVMEWAMGEGLDESTNKGIDNLVNSGRFDELIQLALVDFNEQVASLETSLTQKVSLDKTPYIDIQYIKDKYYPNDTDYTNAFKQAQSNAGAQTNYLYSRILFPRKSTRYTFTNDTPIVLKNNVHMVFESGAEVQYTGAGTSLFTNEPTASSLLLRITGKGRMVVNDKILFNFRYSKSQPYGFSVLAEDMKFAGSDSTRTGTAFSVGWTDFLHFENCNFNNLSKAVEIIPYSTSEVRGNTQIHMDNISMINVGTGLEFDRIDKATFRGVDIAQCGIGFLGHSKNFSMKFINCHVELYDTYAYKFDGSSNINISFDNCSCFNPSNTALGGFYSAPVTWGSYGQNYFVFRENAFVKASQTNVTGYVGFYCPSPFEWHGVDFEFPNAQKVTNNDYPVGGAKIYTGLNRGTFKNLLSVTNVNDTSLLHTYNGTATISTDSTYYNGVKIDWTAAANGNVLQLATRQQLNVGWHTLIIKGSQVGTNNFNLYVNKPNFTTLFFQSMAELSWDFSDTIAPNRTQANLKSQTLTIPFYVDTAGYHYLGFSANSATTYSMVLGGIALVSGFATDYISQDRIWYKSAVPTTGYWYKDDIVYNSSPATGQPIGWRCITSGSPGTWLSLGNYA